MVSTQAAGWYADPWGQAQSRYWDGAQWTGHIHPPSAPQMPYPSPVAPQPQAAAPVAPVEATPELEAQMRTNPVRDPRDSHVFGRRTPMDKLDRVLRHCLDCRRTTVQDRFLVIITAWFGFGLPFTRKQTAGKTGTRACWSVCTECGSVMPDDAVAHDFMARRGGEYLAPRR